ncbi:HAD family hydrolase [Streptomyces sp. NPDC005438]|uniref:HAD family hydrolase n=1 Tax=Streptomyces sp. NPDC005438 TaxID=3156880 RepID=UPI0033B8313C
MRYDLVIFDNDGVLVDSEPLSNATLAGYLSELGFPTSYEESVRDFMGGSMRRVHDTVWRRYGRALPEDFDERFHERVFSVFDRELGAVPEVAELLAWVGGTGTPYCVASSGTHERIRRTLRRTGLYELFVGQPSGVREWRFSSQDVAEGKPAPDLFLHAAKSMGVPPDRCVVIEDSPLGVAAARAAGMDVYGFARMTPAGQLADAVATFTRMSEVPDLLVGPAVTG